MHGKHHGRHLLARLAIVSVTGLSAACAGDSPAGPPVDSIAGPAHANRADVEKGTFSQPVPPAAIVNAPCVDDDPLAVTGTWNGWYRVAQTARGHLHVTEHIDWSEVTLVAADGRTWKPGPGAHESFSRNLPATGEDLGESAYTEMHNLRARFDSQDGDADLRVWHTIHIVLGPDLELRIMKVVLPFVGECIGKSK